MNVVVLGHRGAGKSRIAQAAVLSLKRSRVPTRGMLSAWWPWWLRGSPRPTADITAETVFIRKGRENTPGHLTVIDVPGSLMSADSADPLRGLFSVHLEQADALVVVLPSEPATAASPWDDRWLIQHVQSRVLAGKLFSKEPRPVTLVVVVAGRPGQLTAGAIARRLDPWRHYLDGFAATWPGRCHVVGLEPSRKPGAAAGLPLLAALEHDSGYPAAAWHRLDTALAKARQDPRTHVPDTCWVAPAAMIREAAGKGWPSGPGPLRRSLQVMVTGPPGSGRTSLLCALHHELDPRTPHLWLNPGTQDEMAAMVQGWDALASAKPLPDPVTSRRQWTFRLIGGTASWLEISWRNLSAADPSLVIQASPRADPLLQAGLVLAAVPADLLIAPVTPGNAGAISDHSGLRNIDAAISRVINSAAGLNREAPLLVLAVTRTDLLLTPPGSGGQPRASRTREGLLEDLRLLMPSAFCEGSLTAVCFTSAVGEPAGEAGASRPPSGITDLALLFLLADRIRLMSETVRRLKTLEQRAGIPRPGSKGQRPVFAGRIKGFVGKGVDHLLNRPDMKQTMYRLNMLSDMLEILAEGASAVQFFSAGRPCGAADLYT
jgi:hypothetical protein